MEKGLMLCVDVNQTMKTLLIRLTLTTPFDKSCINSNQVFGHIISVYWLRVSQILINYHIAQIIRMMKIHLNNVRILVKVKLQLSHNWPGHALKISGN